MKDRLLGPYSLRVNSRKNKEPNLASYRLTSERKGIYGTVHEWKYDGNAICQKFTELSMFILVFVSCKRLKMSRFEKGLAFHIHNQQADQPISTY